MRLVPRQLRRSGMAGGVPYYGGRITPTVAYAIDHPDAPVQTQWHPMYQMAGGGTAPRPNDGPTVEAVHVDRRATTEKLATLLSQGVITAEEYDAIVSRLAP